MFECNAVALRQQRHIEIMLGGNYSLEKIAIKQLQNSSQSFLHLKHKGASMLTDTRLSWLLSSQVKEAICIYETPCSAQLVPQQIISTGMRFALFIFCAVATYGEPDSAAPPDFSLSLGSVAMLCWSSKIRSFMSIVIPSQCGRLSLRKCLRQSLKKRTRLKFLFQEKKRQVRSTSFC